MSNIAKHELRVLNHCTRINRQQKAAQIFNINGTITQLYSHRKISTQHYQSESHSNKNSNAWGQYWFLSAGGLLSGGMFLWWNLNKPRLEKRTLLLRESQAVAPDEGLPGADATSKRSKTGFRDNRVIEYENRIKSYSTPDKIFRYYATLKVGNEVYMTPADFVRSIIPDTKQPEGLGLDKFKTFNPEIDTLSEELPEDSFFHKFGDHGMISFSDYVFLLTVLSTPAKNFEVAFKVFDINGDGVVEYHEFDQVASVIRASGSVGQRHRNHKTTGNVINKAVSSALAHYFFGPQLDKKLSIRDFLQFQKELHRGVLELECKKYSKGKDSLSELQFSKLLLMYLPQSAGRKKQMLNRVKKIYKERGAKGAKGESGEDSEGAEGGSAGEGETEEMSICQRIPLEDVYEFWDLLTRLNEVEHAISFWTLSGAAIDKDTFNHVTKIVGKKSLNPHLVEVVFDLFDDDGDGMLSHKEFFEVMKKRVSRNLSKSREIGLHRMFSACWACVKVTDFISPLKTKLAQMISNK